MYYILLGKLKKNKVQVEDLSRHTGRKHLNSYPSLLG